MSIKDALKESEKIIQETVETSTQGISRGIKNIERGNSLRDRLERNRYRATLQNIKSSKK